MSGHQHATIEDTVYFWFAANDTSGTGGDGSTPLFDVREAGAAAGAIPLLSGTPTLLSHANYPAGCYEIAVAATVANGFAADDTFAVFCTLAIDSQNPTGFVGSCTLTPVAKASALTTAQNDLDTITGSDGVTLATTQALYTPAVAGDAMDLVANAVDATSVATDAIDADALAADAIAEINVTVDAALADIGLDHLIFSTLPTNWATDVASGSVFDNIADNGTAVYDRTTDSLQATRDSMNLTASGNIGIDWANVENATNATNLSGTTVNLVNTTTTNTDMVSAAPTAAAIVNEWESQSQTDPTGFHVNVLEWAGNVVTASTGNPDVNIESIDNNAITAASIATDAIASDGLAASAVAEILTTQMTEAYAADGAAPTVAQSLFMIQQLLGEFSISGTTLTMKKLDGSTTAATFTLNDGTNPTSLTRAT